MTPTVLVLCGLFFACPGAPASVPITPNPEDRELIEELDRIIALAKKSAQPLLHENVTTAEQALAVAPVRDQRSNYVVIDYRDWYIVVWQGSGERPNLWFHYTAIRKCSRDMFGSGSF
jgi:hypothetical protein